MKKIFFISLLLFISSSIFARDILTFGVTSGLINGTFYEYVYHDTRTETNFHISELDWDVINIPYVEFSMNFSPAKNFLFDFKSKFGIPKNSGYMQDYDWLNNSPSGLSNWKNDYIGELTNYSIHTNHLESYVDCSLTLSGIINLEKNIQFYPFVTFAASDIYFGGYDGYGIYKSNQWVKLDYTDNIISYNIVSRAVFFGYSFKVCNLKKFDIMFTEALSPDLSFTDAYDIHILRNITFHDIIYEAFVIKGDISVDYLISDKNKIGMRSSVVYHPESYGSTSKVTNYQGGISYFLYDFALTYKYSR